VAAALALSSVAGFAQQPPGYKPPYFVPPPLVDGQPDPGVTTPLPNGGTQTTYATGWTTTTEPDNSFGAGGTKVTQKDQNGRVHIIIKYDPKHTLRHETAAEDQPDGTIKITNWNFTAGGELIDNTTETMKRTSTEASGPETSPQGPPPDADSGAPGGFGFGVGVGGFGSGQDRGRDSGRDSGRRP
jgi:hypothetical protein